jgi:hypothetical protein
MDSDKMKKSNLGNDNKLKNAERNNVGVKTSDARRDNDKPVTPISQDSGKHDPKNQDPRSAEPKRHPANEDPTKHDPVHDTTESGTRHPANEVPTKHDPMHDSTKSGPSNQDAAKHDKSKTATGGSKQ